MSSFTLSWSEVLGWMAFVIHLSAFVIYNRKMLSGQVRPNAATWTIWAFAASLNCLTYFFISEDWVKVLVPIAGSTACIFTFFFSLARGGFRRPDRFDIMVLVMGLGALLLWWWTRQAAHANLLLQVALNLAFIPVIRDVWDRPDRESPLPWSIWTLAYCVQLTIVLGRGLGHWEELVYPVTAILSHGLIGVLALRRRNLSDRP